MSTIPPRRRSLIFISFLTAIATPAWSPLPARAQEPPAAKQLTVERLYSAPSLSGHIEEGVSWSPDSKQVSYFHRTGDGGDKELRVIDASTGKSTVLIDAQLLASLLEPEKAKNTQATGLGRATPDAYEWAPDGKSILFVGDSELVWFDLASRAPKKLVTGDTELEDVKISPDGKWVSYLRKFNLWIVNVASSEKRQITQGGSEEILKAKLDWLYPEELSCGTAYWWSPDSTRIAYYEMDERKVTKYPIYDMSSDTGAVESTRFPQAGEANPIVRVGVIAITGGETRWLDTGADKDVYIARVNWLPNGKQIAIQRLNRAQTHLDLLLTDAATGRSRSILSEDDKHWINLSDDLRFFADSRRFLWTSERSGFRHIYFYDLTSKEPKQLTGGDWSVTGIESFGPRGSNGLILDERHDFVYFLANKDNPLETNLYRVDIKTGFLTRITQGSGVHGVEVAPDASAFVDNHSEANTPNRQDVYRVDGSLVGALCENKIPELAEYNLSPVEFATIQAADGTTLYASIVKPPNFSAAQKYPVLIEVYGGPDAQIVRNLWDPGSLFSRLMAQKGYIVWTLDNRGGTGRGHAFETPVYHHLGKVELEDQLAGVNYLKSLSYVDPARIGIWGWSYGGFMTLTALFHAPDVFKAGVAVAPVTDWKLYDTAYTERYMGAPQSNAAGYNETAPANFTQNLQSKLLLAQGTGDDNVHFANMALLLNHFIESEKYPELMIFPGRGHPIGDRPARIDLFNKIAQFFVDNL
jgi:dipeptidyl-peptidase-4